MGEVANWVPALTVNGLFLALIFLLRNLIGSRLTQSVKHEYDDRLERLKNDLQREAKEVEDMRATVLSSLSGDRSVIFSRKIKAIDELSDAFYSYRSESGVVATMALLNVEGILSVYKNNIDVGSFVSKLKNKRREDEGEVLRKAEIAKPYVSKWSWGLYVAYRSLVTHERIRMDALGAGLDPAEIVDTAAALEVLKVALPSYAQKIDSEGMKIFPRLLIVLEDTFSEELRNVLAGAEEDVVLIERSSRIVDAVRRADKDGGSA